MTMFITNPDVDLVYISTPISTRFELLKNLFYSKRMLFLEKPSFLNYEQVFEISKILKINNVSILDGWS